LDAAIDSGDTEEQDANATFAFEETSLHADDDRRLRLSHPPSSRHWFVIPVRAFPLTAPNRAICLLDDRGHEISYIDDLNELATATRELIESDLASREFRPIVQHIDRIDVLTTHAQWHVTTDRGQVSFAIEDEEQVRALGDGRYVIVDQSGTRFVVPNLQGLDSKSRRALHRFA
jgi:hypothetical protein